MKLLYKPFGILSAFIGAKLGKRAFEAIWSQIDEHGPPNPTTGDANVTKAVGGAALHAATLAGSKALATRASARSFHYIFGIWPGGEHAASDEAEAS